MGLQRVRPISLGGAEVKAFTVSTDGGTSATVKAYTPQAAAHKACDQLWDQSAGEAFDVHGEPTLLTVTDEDGAVTMWRAFAEASINYWVTE